MSQLQSRYVFLDTQAYVRARFDWSGPQLGKILDLAKAGTIRLLIHSITRREVYRHMEQRLSDAKESLRKHAALLDQVGISLEPLEQNPNEVARQAFDKFLKDAGASGIDVRIDLDALLSDYFAHRLPFESVGAKKHEFPDAIVCASLLEWCANGLIYVVSGDKGIRSFCEKNAEKLLHVEEIAALISLAITTDEIYRALKAQLISSQELVRLLTLKLHLVKAQTPFSERGLDAAQLHAEGDVASVDSVEITDAYALAADGSNFRCHIELRAKLTLRVSVQDWRNAPPYDPDEYDATLSVFRRFTAYATVAFNPESRKLLELKSVSIPANMIELDPIEIRERT